MSGEMRHIEMFADDLETARAFYEGMFDWDFKDLKLSGAGFMRWEVCCGLDGVFRKRETGSPDDLPGPINYIAVDDVETVCRRVEKHGGEVLFCSEQLVEGGPRLALFADPDGNILGLWQKMSEELMKQTLSKDSSAT